MLEGNMKKFVQLFLIVLSVISTSLFVFYKHEYNRLRSVLEVLDTFGSNAVGKPSQPSETNTNANEFASFSVWRKFGPFFTYSAFAKQNEKQTRVQILTIVPVSVENSGKCSVWFDNKKIPVLGNLSMHQLYHQSEDDTLLKPVLLECVTVRTGQTPHAVAPYASREQGNAEAIDIVHEPLSFVKKKSDAVHACLLPLSEFFDSHLNFAEFVVFHQAVGIEKFYLYINTISLAVKKLLATHMQNKTFIVNYWNVPEELNQPATLSIVNAILMNDCLFRSRSMASYLVITDTEKFLMPKHHTTIGAVLSDISAVVTYPISQMHCHHKIFCTESQEYRMASSEQRKQSLSLLKRTQWHFQENDVEDFYILNTDKMETILSITDKSVDHIYNVPENVMLIRWYKVCTASDRSNLVTSDDEGEKYLWLKDLFSKSSLIHRALHLNDESSKIRRTIL